MSGVEISIYEKLLNLGIAGVSTGFMYLLAKQAMSNNNEVIRNNTAALTENNRIIERLCDKLEND